MKTNSKIFIFSVLIILLVMIVLYYYGFIYSFKNFSGGGSGYPLAGYTIPLKMEKANYILDSISKADNFTVQNTGNNINSSTKYRALLIGSPKDSITYDIEFRTRSTKTDTTVVYIWSILSQNESITPYSIKDIDKTNLDRSIRLFENAILAKIK